MIINLFLSERSDPEANIGRFINLYVLKAGNGIFQYDFVLGNFSVNTVIIAGKLMDRLIEVHIAGGLWCYQIYVFL